MSCPVPACVDVVAQFPMWNAAEDEYWIDESESRAFARRTPGVLRERDFRWLESVAPDRASVLNLMDVIQNSLSIAELRDDWDGEGSVGYSDATLAKAVAFLTRTVGLFAPSPRINPADNGSIDLYWKDDNRFLLINFPPGDGEPSYYGEDRFGSTTQGIIKSDSMGRQVVDWLTLAGR